MGENTLFALSNRHRCFNGFSADVDAVDLVQAEKDAVKQNIYDF